MLSHFEHYRAAEWSGAAVAVTDVTDAWSVIAVAGPQSRAALHRVLGPEWVAGIDALKHMDCRTGTFDGQDVTVMRASFSGELAFELHVRPAVACRLWDALVEAGMAPYGLDALDILRVEKGYLVSSELNGQTTPMDLNMDGLIAVGNPCVGRELLARPAFHEPTRPRLVGLRAADGRAAFAAGSQLRVPGASRRPCGYITSSVYSPALECWIGLALLARNVATDGHRLVACDPLRSGDTEVVVCATTHFDPAGTRMKA
jgi:sarcosine oxidase subunit alpha